MSHRIRTIVENYSKYPVSTVWENAQDLEHVTRLHPNTNQAFELLATHRSESSAWEYDVLIYRAIRKVGPFRFDAFGFRKIISENNLHQFEYIPLLKTTSMLNSLLFPSAQEGFQTRMVDEVVMYIPSWLRLFEKRIRYELKIHAEIQCAEDEPFRARRVELTKRNVHRPFRIFSETRWDQIANEFHLNLNSPPA